jgi:hypothetical protein
VGKLKKPKCGIHTYNGILFELRKEINSNSTDEP